MIVADANLVVYLLIDGDYTQAAHQVRKRNRPWMVPALFRSELLNVLCSQMRIYGMERDDALKLFQRGMSMVQVSDAAVDAAGVLNLCKSLKSSSYDAEYVLLAESLGVPLVTQDAALLRAVPNIAVSIAQAAGAT